MAQRVQVILIDDVSGGDATESIEFALDGVAYEIDLNDENAARLREELAPWIGQARRSGGRRQTRRRGASSSGPSEDLSKIREWGRENGFKVSSRGRVSQDLRDAYAAAH